MSRFNWVSCINKDQFLEHATLIDAILNGEVRVEKMVGIDIYKTRINDVKRFFWVSYIIDGQPHMLVLPVDNDFIKHKYERFKFRQKAVLQQHVAKVMIRLEQDHTHLKAAVIDSNMPPEQDIANILATTTLPCDEVLYDSHAYFYGQQFIHLSAAQQYPLTYGLPAVFSGLAGSGKSCVLSKLAQELLESMSPDEPRKILYIAESPQLIAEMKQHRGENSDHDVRNHRIVFKTYDQLLRYFDTCALHLMAVPAIDKRSQYAQQYIWNGQQLIYIQHDLKLQRIPLNNISLFSTKVALLKTSKTQTTLFLSSSQIEDIVTANGGHEHFGSFLPENKVGEQAFFHWFNAYLKHQPRSELITFFKQQQTAVYQEFRIISVYADTDSPTASKDKNTPFTFDDYRNLGKDHTLFHASKMPGAQDFLLNAYTQYKLHLNQTGLWDPSFCRLKLEDQFYAVLADEALDLSLLQMIFLYFLAHNGNICYAVDSHQMLHDWISHRPWLLQALSKLKKRNVSHINLPESYRSSNAIIDVANVLVQLKYRLTKGTADKFEQAQIPHSSDPTKMNGKVYHFSPMKSEDDALMSVFPSTEYVVITLEQYKEEARKRYNTSLVFTPEEIKGLQYKHVIAYKLLDLLANENKTLQKRASENNMYLHRAKHGQSEQQFAPMFNRVITALMRATDNLYLVQDNEYHIAYILNALNGFINQDTIKSSENKPQQPISAASQLELYTHAEKLYKNGHHEQARQLFLNELGKSEAEFGAFEELYAENEETLEINSTPATDHLLISLSADQTSTNQSPDTVATKRLSPLVASSIFDASSPQPPKKMAQRLLGLLKHFTIDHLKNWFKLEKNHTSLCYPIQEHGESTQSLLECILIQPERAHTFFEFLSQSSSCLSILQTIETHFRLPDQSNAIHIAANLNLFQLIELFFKNKMSIDEPNEHGVRPIFLTLDNTKLLTLKALIAAGANVTTPDNSGMTPLIQAILNNHAMSHIGVIITLLKHGADLTINDYCEQLALTPLIAAAEKGDLAIVRILYQAGHADVNALGAGRTTPIFAALSNGHHEVVDFLLANGADLKIALESHPTLLLLALQMDHRILFQALLSAGADPGKLDEKGNNVYSQARKMGLNNWVLDMLDKTDEIRGRGIITDREQHNKSALTICSEEEAEAFYSQETSEQPVRFQTPGY